MAASGSSIVTPPSPEHMLLLPPSPWSDIPEELLGLIIKRVSNDWSDLYQCLTVCSSWRSTARQVLSILLATPYLLLIDRYVQHTDLPRCRLVDLNNNKTIIISVPPNLLDCTVYTSIRGWLLFSITEYCTPKYGLYNPMTRQVLRFPAIKLSQPPFRMNRFFKLVISTSPLDPESFVFVLSKDHRRLSAVSYSGRRFKSIRSTGIEVADMIFYEDELYSVDFFGTLRFVQLFEGGEHVVEKLHIVAGPCSLTRSEFHFVEEPVSKELMVIEKVKDDLKPFRVFKLNGELSGGAKWEQVSKFDSDHHALLFRSGDSIFVSTANDHTTFHRPNCIYYIEMFDDCSDPLNYLKVYDLVHGTVDPLRINRSSYTSDIGERLWSGEYCRWFRPSIV